MRLGGRLTAAIEVLEDIERRHRPAGDALKDWGLSHRFAGSGDRAAIGNIVYDVLRRKRSSAWLVDDDSARGRAFGALVLGAGVSAAALNESLAGDRFAPAPLGARELAAIETRDVAEAPPEIRADCPDWCIPHLKRAFGDEWVQEADALARRPPLDLRVNTLAADREKVLGELHRTGAAHTALASAGLRVPPIAGNGRHPNVQSEPAFQKGWFEVQDEGSQIVGEMAGAEPGMQVLDFCAGAGGKTLALAAGMQNKGQIFAHDSQKVRLAPIFDRLRRAGARNVQAVAEPAALEPLKDRMDVVLVDAPCTGSGTWRRRPDAKWRLTERQLVVRQSEQRAILDAAARFVKPGGRLVYITCSVFEEENAAQVAAFAARDGAFSPAGHHDLWANRFGMSVRPRIEDKGGITLTPFTVDTDGFFCAVLERGRT